MTARSIASRRHIRTDTRLSNGRGDGISGRDGRRARSRVSARPRPVCLYQRRSWTPRQPSRSVAAGPDATPGRRRGRAGAPGACGVRGGIQPLLRRRRFARGGAGRGWGSWGEVP
ncbi:hypothetical protein PAHAL_6G263900 [Panicum hallii]|uniref:Uncharacterized protein n=1 Tax=Panicum hallii TaxID=206008 RepID=A0A2T8IHP8_9POAL|nr:hypothetical protein PAHAL_6G263900 [Panicum hallii]